jgi:hypothetical protein
MPGNQIGIPQQSLSDVNRVAARTEIDGQCFHCLIVIFESIKPSIGYMDTQGKKTE